MKLEIVRSAEYLIERTHRYLAYQFTAFDQSWSEERVLQVGMSLSKTGNAVVLGDRAASEPAQLRKHEPHPMAALTSRAQLKPHLPHELVLRTNKALEIHTASGHQRATARRCIAAATYPGASASAWYLSLIHISEPTRQAEI